MSDLKLLQDLNAKGVALALNVPAIGGVQTQSISPEQALGLLTDAEQVYAEVLGLTRTQYVEWHASQGCVYCRATTRAGDRCRNFVIRAPAWSQPDGRRYARRGLLLDTRRLTPSVERNEPWKAPRVYARSNSGRGEPAWPARRRDAATSTGFLTSIELLARLCTRVEAHSSP